jgi:Cys-tRNA(Pro)/Cys-tRNA(Cys) deacylase
VQLADSTKRKCAFSFFTQSCNFNYSKLSNFAALRQQLMKKITKTNAARLLDAADIQYELIPYEVDESDLGAQHIADQLGENIDQVFKTLILEGDKTGHLVCVIPGAEEVDLKKAAKVSGNKKVDLIPMKELLPTTGYIRGGCSPVGMKKPFPTYFDETCILYDYIYVSAGVRGLQFKIDPQALVDFVGAETVDLIA